MRYYKRVVAAAAASLAAAAIYSVRDRKTLELIGNGTLVKDDSDISSGLVVRNKLFDEAIRKSQASLLQVKDELGLPGLVVGVSVHGRLVWAQGYGLANVETQTPCDAGTKMRIASISKPITTALLARLQEAGLVDLDRPVQAYVPYFPTKTVDGRVVELTARLLCCHKAGVRHYNKDVSRAGDQGDGGPEFYLTERFKSIEKSVALFKDDDLLFRPGSKFEYTTHGYTLLSAVIEGAGKAPFTQQLKQHIQQLGLNNTHLDEVPTIVYGRASYYRRTTSGRLANAELTDNSYKWAGGGLVSDVADLCTFADTLLHSYQQAGAGAAVTGLGKPCFLTPAAVKELWTPVEGTKMSWTSDAGYGLGWTVVPERPAWVGPGARQRFHVGHGGGAVGASSVLLVFPLPRPPQGDLDLPSGVSVAIITNLQNAGLYRLGKQIAENFIQES